MSAPGQAPPATRFRLPAGLSATEPPESRGLSRDGVRLLVADGRSVRHARFRDLARYLDAGDLLVVNTSATIAAAVDGARTGGRPVRVHFSTALDDGTWVVELRHADAGVGRIRDGWPGEQIALPAGVDLRLLAPHPGPTGDRLWRARVAVEGGVEAYLAREGRPITYGYLRVRPPLDAFQTVFARDPGSAEMPSAGRPFTPALVTELVSAGVLVAPVLLHTGVSSPESGEPPLAERFRVPLATADLVNQVRRRRRRIVAVGTTVARALESAATAAGEVVALRGWTDLVLGPDRPARVVNGLVTGLHEPGASHLLLLEAVAGAALVRRAYAAAVRARYRWHEFGDSSLLLPKRTG